METIDKIQTRQKETLRTFDSILSVLAPVTFDNKCYFIDDKNIDRLAKSSDFISSEFCAVSVVKKNPDAPDYPTETDKCYPDMLIQIEGENFGYQVAPDALPHLRKQIEKSFKEVETFTKKAAKQTPAPAPIKPAEVKESPKTAGFHWSKATEPAETNPERAELQKEINRKQETARYLYGNKRGAWGHQTKADEKRAAELSNLKSRLKNTEPPAMSINTGKVLKTDSAILPKDSIKDYICDMKTVNFQIEGRYIDQIKAGTKTEDYRGIGPVNAKKLCDHIKKEDLKPGEQYVTNNKEIWRLKKDLTHVRFFNGYHSDRKELVCELKGLELNKFTKVIPEGMKPGTICFTLILGQIVVSKNFTP